MTSASPSSRLRQPVANARLIDPTLTVKGEGLGEPIKAGSLRDSSKNLLVEFETFRFIKTAFLLQLQLYPPHNTIPSRRSKEIVS
jgi:hypothetical protein